MYYGRNDKSAPTGFDAAASVYTERHKFSPEAASNLTQMVRDVASQYDYNDSAALKNLRSRLNRAARVRRSQGWAQEVLAGLPKKSLYGTAPV